MLGQQMDQKNWMQTGNMVAQRFFSPVATEVLQQRRQEVFSM